MWCSLVAWPWLRTDLLVAASREPSAVESWLRAAIQADDRVLIPLLGVVLVSLAAGWWVARCSRSR